MAKGRKFAILKTAIAAWGDTFRAFRLMTIVFAVAIVIRIPLDFLRLNLVPVVPGGPSGWAPYLWLLVDALAQSFVLTPLLVAVHRFVLLDETTSHYRVVPQDRRLLRFFGALATIWMLGDVPQVLSELASEGPVHGFLAIISFILLLTFIPISVRIAILFPSIAIDASGAHWRNALKDTEDHSWPLLLATFSTMLPAAVVLIAMYRIADPRASLIAQIAGAAVNSIVGVFAMAALAAMASHIYTALANQLERPPGDTALASTGV